MALVQFDCTSAIHVGRRVSDWLFADRTRVRMALIDIAKRVGLTEEQVDDIGSYQTTSRFNDNDKLILRYAEELTLSARVDDDLSSKVENNCRQGQYYRSHRRDRPLEHDGAQPQRLRGRTRIVVRAKRGLITPASLGHSRL